MGSAPMISPQHASANSVSYGRFYEFAFLTQPRSRILRIEKFGFCERVTIWIDCDFISHVQCILGIGQRY